MENIKQVQESQVLVDLKNTLSRHEKSHQRRETSYNYLKKLSPEAIRELFESVVQQSLRWEAENAVFVMFIDQLSISRRLGKNGYRQYWQTLQTSEHLRSILPILSEIRELSPEEILYLQALFNLWLQIILGVEDRAVQIGHAPLNMTFSAILKILWRDKDFETFKVIIDRDEFPPVLHSLLIKILEELDFEATEQASLYQLELAESTIEELAGGALIKSSKKGMADGTAAGKLADAMMLRQAEKLLRKILFSIRALSMYPSGHPGLKKSFESTMETIGELMENRRMVVITQLAGSILVNEIRIKAEDRIVLQFIEILEEKSVSSITFLPEINAREIEMLVKLFNSSVSSVKDEGGPRSFLLNKGVEHIILDQYRYGVIGSDEEIVHVTNIGWGGDGGTGSGDGPGDGGGLGLGDGTGLGPGGTSGNADGAQGGAGIEGGTAVLPGTEHAGNNSQSGFPGFSGASMGPGYGPETSAGTGTVSAGTEGVSGRAEESDDDINFSAVEGFRPGGAGEGAGSGGVTGKQTAGSGGPYPGGMGGSGSAPGHGPYGGVFTGTGAGTRKRPGKSAEIILLHDIVGRVSGGGAMTDISNEEIGHLFKRILTGEIDRHQEYRKSLAELIVALDPDFLKRAIIDSPEVRERLAWSVSRKIITKTLDKLQSKNLDERNVAIEILQHIAELAIVRQKDSSLRQIIEKLIENLSKIETDLDTSKQLADVIGSLISKIVINGNLKMALDFLNDIRNAQDKIALHPSRHQLTYRINALKQVLLKVSSQDTVRYLVRQLGKDKRSTVQRTVAILKMLETEEVVVQLISVFEHGARRERKRAYELLLSMSEVAGDVITHHLSVLQDREYFPRKPDNIREMVDEAWYRVRNSLGVLAKIKHKDAERIFNLAIHDQDYRVRKETIYVMMNARHPATAEIAKALLKDPDDEVRNLAILAMRDPSERHAVDDLVQLFMNEPNLRKQILETLAGIEQRKSKDFVYQCLLLSEPDLRKMYLKDINLQIWAIQCLAEYGSSRELQILQTFKERHQSVYKRLRYFPVRYAIKSKKVIYAINNAISHLEQQKLDIDQEKSIIMDDETPKLDVDEFVAN